MKIECRFDDVVDGVKEGILVRGLFLVGASWDRSRNIIMEDATSDNLYCEMPVIRSVD